MAAEAWVVRDTEEMDDEEDHTGCCYRGVHHSKPGVCLCDVYGTLVRN